MQFTLGTQSKRLVTKSGGRKLKKSSMGRVGNCMRER